MSENATFPEQRNCPQCQVDVRPDASTGEAPSFCLRCRFPLMLVAGKYRLLRVLGEGGFATVYEAHHTQMKGDPRRVAKFLKPELMAEPGMTARFRREVEVTSKLSQNSHHIVRIFDDFGELPNLGAFYVMEYLDGLPLSEIMSKEGLLPLARCYDLFDQLCEAMRVAHEEDVVHRDLKPENLFLIQHEDAADWLKVIDFGIAKPVGTEKAVTKITQGVLGTPAYMAPELYMNQKVGPYTDIYAMGIILYELLTGHTPFAPPNLPSPSAASFMASHIMEAAPSMLPMLPAGRDVPASIDAVVRKALSKQPADRFASVAELLDTFQAALTGRLQAQDISVDAFGTTAYPADLAQPNAAEEWGNDDEMGEGTALDYGSIGDLYSALSADSPPSEATVIQSAPTDAGLEQESHVVVSSMSLPASPEHHQVDTPSPFLPAVSHGGKHVSSVPAGNVLIEELALEDAVYEEGTAVTKPPSGLHMLLHDSPMTQEDLPALSYGMRAPTQPMPQATDHTAPQATIQTPAPRNSAWLIWSVGGSGALAVFVLLVWWWSLPAKPTGATVSALRDARDAGAAGIPALPFRAIPQDRPDEAVYREAPTKHSLLPFPNSRNLMPPRRSLPRSVRPRSRRRRQTTLCPRRGSYKWIYLTFGRRALSHIDVQVKGRGRHSIRRRRHGLCVGVTSSRMRVVLSLAGQHTFESCSFTFARYAPRAQVRFRKREGELLSLTPDKCLRRH